MRVLSRDPFARADTVRETIHHKPDGRDCDWCGTHRASLYRYGTQRDDRNNVDWHRGEFCNKSCHDSYHG